MCSVADKIQGHRPPQAKVPQLENRAEVGQADPRTYKIRGILEHFGCEDGYTSVEKYVE